MIYAVRYSSAYLRTLVEFKGLEELYEAAEDTTLTFVPVSEQEAHQWVRSKRGHDTGLFIDDDGVAQYAEAER